MALSTEELILERLERMEQTLNALHERRVHMTPWWTYQDIADYMQVSEKTARRIADQPGFPTGMRIPTSGDGSRVALRFDPAEVRAFLTSPTCREIRLR